MVWVIYFVIAMFATTVLTRFKNIKRLWVMGLATMLFLYIIDSTLMDIGAYTYHDSNFIFGGLPIFYLLAGFPGGILFAYFYPANRKLQFPYVLLAVAIFILMEIIIKWFGYIEYIKWNIVHSIFLDILGFMAILWLGQWLNATGKGEK